MSEAIIHRARIENGKLIFRDRNRFLDWLETLRGDVEVIIRKYRERRSQKQNRYYWAYMEIIENETGDNANDLHEYLKRKLLSPRYKTILGKEVILPATTTELDKLQFANYITKIEALTGVPAPSLDDVL